MKLYEQQRASNLVRQLWRIFFPDSANTMKYFRRKRKPILSRTIMDQIKGSPVTVDKAKKALLIRSKRIAGRWYWVHPKRTLEEALHWLAVRSAHPDSIRYRVRQDKHEINKKHCIEGLTDCFHLHNYKIRADEAMHYMSTQWHLGQRGHFFSEAKKEMGIGRFKEEGVWYWVWSDDVVVDWLQQVLENGPLSKEIICSRAAEEKNWSEDVLLNAKIRFGGILTYRGQWYDINSWSPPQQAEGEAQEGV